MRITVHHVRGGQLARRGGTYESPFLIGTTKPTAENTGVQPGITLTAKTGDLIITTPGTTIEAEDREGRYLIRAADVTIRNCRARGYSTVSSGAVDCNHSAVRNALIEHCDLGQSQLSVYTDGIIGHDYTARRCLIRHTVDGFGVFNSNDPSVEANVTIEGCYVEHLAYQSPCPPQSDDRTHNDGIQIQGNGGVTIRGNNLNGSSSPTWGHGNLSTVPAPNPYYPSVTGQTIGITPNLGTSVNNITITDNWLDYGVQSITGITNGRTVNNFVLTGNRFGRSQPPITKEGVRTSRPVLLVPTINAPGLPSVTGPDINNGNVYEDDGSPITVYRTTSV